MALPPGIRHVRPPEPLHFPATDPEGDVGQSNPHWNLCTLLEAIVKHDLGERATVGADQYVYYDAVDLQACIAPDVFVKLGPRKIGFSSWRTSESGVPEVCFEILSDSDRAPKAPLVTKLASYRKMGTRELFVLDLDAPHGARLRAWDCIAGDFVERIVDRERSASVVLDCDVVVAPMPPGHDPWALRLERDGTLVPSEAEFERAAKEAERAAKEAERAAKEAALARVAELEALVGKKR